MKASEQYHQENAMMFAKLEELSGKVESKIAQVKSSDQKIIGLEFELKRVREERDELKKKLNFLKRQKNEAKLAPDELNRLASQNFSIRNKIAKIVTDIEGQEVSEEGVRELMQTLIGEIDECIRLLQ